MQLRLFGALLALGTLSQAFNQDAINVFNSDRLRPKNRASIQSTPQPPTAQKAPTQRFLTDKSRKFVVNGTAIPDVPFDVGESYAGLLPISQDPNEERQLYFWFFPSTNSDAPKEVVIWLNGGPGCSSLAGLLTENGPFLWQEGTLAPTPNSYSWTNLTNVVWVEQPVGVGFSRGKPNITNEVELGVQFAGFWRNFIDTFSLEGATTYITGESYAGYYVPYIADAFLSAGDEKYYKLGGVGINDPILGDDTLQSQAVVYPFVESWQSLFNLNQSYMNALRWTHEHCNYSSYLAENVAFPAKGPWPPIQRERSRNGTCDIFSWALDGATNANPCFNLYHISETCPFVNSQLGIVNQRLTPSLQGDYSPKGARVYFNRTDVQDAINAPRVTWRQCTPENVFGGGANPKAGDTSDGAAQNGVLQRVIERTNNVVIGVGRLDFILPPNGTLFALQNMTWNGRQGFEKYPQEQEFYVPYHPEFNDGRLSESGVVGAFGAERGLTYYEVHLAGHELPGYAAGSGYRVLELLLGRIKSLGSVEDFSTQREPGGFQGNATMKTP
ncbi:carboxypeptidase [Colletotrichum plurivorum]|uniref:Carboxypeptidase n=1 Tax=Colletotrichum plurivorum TaxID=2175906 RepID=A0A8H6KMW0_9PEZI|nr:carboxypeptidase [Colletotrichum plurivorum]